MKSLLFATLTLAAAAGYAENTEFSVITACTGADAPAVNVERRVVDLYTPQVRFEDRVVADGRVLGTAESTADRGTIKYAGAGFSLVLTQDYGSMTMTSPGGAYTIEGTAVLSENGRAPVSLECVTYDHM